MQARLVMFPSDDGLAVVIWAKWTRGSMRVRNFQTRTEMIAVLETLRLIREDEARRLEDFDFVDSCPLFSSEIDEDLLAAHGFEPA